MGQLIRDLKPIQEILTFINARKINPQGIRGFGVLCAAPCRTQLNFLQSRHRSSVSCGYMYTLIFFVRNLEFHLALNASQNSHRVSLKLPEIVVVYISGGSLREHFIANFMKPCLCVYSTRENLRNHEYCYGHDLCARP